MADPVVAHLQAIIVGLNEDLCCNSKAEKVVLDQFHQYFSLLSTRRAIKKAPPNSASGYVDRCYLRAREAIELLIEALEREKHDG